MGSARIERRRAYSFISSSCGHDGKDVEWTSMVLVLGKVGGGSND